MSYRLTDDWQEVDGTTVKHRTHGPLTLALGARLGSALHDAYMKDWGRSKDDVGALERQKAKVPAIYQADQELRQKLPWVPVAVQVLSNIDGNGIVRFAIVLHKTDPATTCPKCGATLKVVTFTRQTEQGWVAPSDASAPKVEVPRERDECPECEYKSEPRRPKANV